MTAFIIGNTITTWTLVSLLKCDGHAKVEMQGQTYTFDSVQREDGSGGNFNLTLRGIHGNIVHKYVKTVD